MNKKIISRLSKVIFFIGVVLFLGIYNYDFLYQVGWKNYFLFNSFFTQQTISQSCGVLLYIARFLNLLFHYPLIGAISVATILTGMVALHEYLFDKRKSGFSFLPSVLLTMVIGCGGWAIYARFEIGTFFALILGTVCCLISYLLYDKFFKGRNMAYVMLIVQLVLLPVLGVFSMVSIVMIAVEEYLEKKKGLLLLCYLLLPLGVAVGEIYVVSHFFYGESFAYALRMPLPDPYFTRMFVCSLCLLCCLMVSPLIKMIEIPVLDTFHRKFPFHPILLLLCSFVLVYFVSFHETNYRSLMKFSRLCDEMKWREIVERCKDIAHPTKGVNAYRVIAQGNLGRECEKLFDVNMPLSPCSSPYKIEEIVYEADLTFYASFLAASYHQNMDNWVIYGESFRYLKNMTFISLLRGDDELAARYIYLMKQTSFLDDLADEYATYLNNKELLYKKYPICKKIKGNEVLQDVPQNVFANLAEYYLAYSRFNNDNLKRCVLAKLFVKDIKGALNDYLTYVKDKKDLYQYMSEAAVLYATQTNDDTYVKALQVNDNVVNKVVSCLREYYLLQQNKQTDTSKLCRKYKGSYVLFYIMDIHKFQSIKE